MYGEGERVYTKIYGCVFTESGNQKPQFFVYVINDRPVIKKRHKQTCKTDKNTAYLNQFFDGSKLAKLINTRSSQRRCSIEKVFLKISQIRRKKPVLNSLYKNVKDTLQPGA